MATCHLCPPEDWEVPDVELLHHLRVIHPDVTERAVAWMDDYVLGSAQRWPDGGLVVVDTTLEPGDFGGAP